MNVLVVLQCLLFFLFQEALCSVILFGGQYCRTDIGDGTHSDPGDMITINCEVDNPNGGLNVLIWSIPTQTIDIVHVNDVQGDTTSVDVNGVNFVSTVISSDDTEGITNASLTFLASSFLDEAVVICTNAENIMNNCTLFIKTSPSAPEVSFPNCTDITYQSLVLQWNPPSDDGGESISHYSITRTPDDISIITDTTMRNVSDLTPNTVYTFNVSVNNSLGFSEELPIKCNTPGEVPPGFTDVDICLDVDTNFNTVLDIKYSPCPIVITDTDTTPPVDNYTVEITDLSPVNIATDTCDYNIPVSERESYTVKMSVNNIIGSSEKTTAGPFIASWLRDVQVTDVTNTSAIILYTTADCVVNELENSEIELIITDSPVIDPSSPVLYENATDGIFSLSDLQPNGVLTYTLQVITEVMGSTITIGMIHTGSFTVSPTPSSTTTSTTSISSTVSPLITSSLVNTGSFTVSPTPSSTTTTSTTSMSSSVSPLITSVSITVSMSTYTPTPCVTYTEVSGLSAPLLAGITAVVTIPVSSIISSLLTLLVVYLCCGKNKGDYSINTTSPVYETPLPGSNITRTSEFEMKGNQAYGHVISAPRSTSEYETVTS